MKKFLKAILVIIVLLVTWITADWHWPVKKSIHEFNPDIVAELDTKMWRSYYGKQPVKMFFQFAGLLRTEFHAPFWRSNIMAYYASKAAFVFKNGKNQQDYEKALPYLDIYYTQLHRISKEDFNIKQAAATELEWWIVHRDKKQYTYNDLQLALQKNISSLFSMHDTAFKRYAYYRTIAMQLRDEKQLHGGVTEQDWQMIDSDLHQSWNELYAAVNNDQHQ
jgi:hypothetical protein